MYFSTIKISHVFMHSEQVPLSQILLGESVGCGVKYDLQSWTNQVGDSQLIWLTSTFGLYHTVQSEHYTHKLIKVNQSMKFPVVFLLLCSFKIDRKVIHVLNISGPVLR